jgi:hypothetical protein
MQPASPDSTSLPPPPKAPSGGWTVAEIAAALERLGFLVQPPLQGDTDKVGLDFLASILESKGATEEGQKRIREWLEQRRDALNEDLSRILLGETPPDAGPPAPAEGEDCLRWVRPLAEDLAELARQLKWVA